MHIGENWVLSLMGWKSSDLQGSQRSGAGQSGSSGATGQASHSTRTRGQEPASRLPAPGPHGDGRAAGSRAPPGDGNPSDRGSGSDDRSAGKPRLLDLVRERLRVKHYSGRTEHAYIGWIRRFILANDKRHPRELGAFEVEQFLSGLAVQGKVAASTQNQALSALLFLYR